MSAAKPKLTEAEIGKLVAAAEKLIPAEKLVPALAEAIGPIRAARLVATRAAIPWTKADTEAVAMALYPLIPGANAKAKRRNLTAALKPCFATLARYEEVMSYVMDKVEEWLSGPAAPDAPVPVPGRVPDWSACTRMSCWNGSNAGQRMMNMFSVGMNDATFDAFLAWMVGLGCNAACVFVANLADGPLSAPGCSIYGTGKKWSWAKDPATIAHFQKRIAKIRAKMAYVPWLMADESEPYSDAMIKDPARYASDLASTGVLEEASFVCLGLEMDEYGWSDAQVAKFAAAVRAVYPGKIATHQTSGKWSLAKHGDIVMYQVNPGKTPAQISAEVKKVRAATGKPVCMFEMERHPASDAQIKAAFDAGAFSVANWNGTAAALFPAQPQSAAGEPTHLGDDVDLSKAEWVGKINGANALVTDDLAPFSHDTKTFYYKQTPGTKNWKPRFTDNGKDLNSAACLAVWRDGRWRVGRFDDCSETRNTREKKNIVNGYLKGIRPAVGEPFRFLLVNADGKYRTKAPGGIWTQ